MQIDYDHSRNTHTLAGARAALPRLFQSGLPESLLDVGCGEGTWLRAALELGVPNVVGIDGIAIPAERLLIPADRFIAADLRAPIDLGTRFSAALCLEVAEHLEKADSEVLFDTLIRHADLIVFSAACPGQTGQHHVNCRWPSFWQGLFNMRGFVCSDEIRWVIWDDDQIEPWYRQNMFIARRDLALAGSEPRIKSVLHPAMEAINREAEVAEVATSLRLHLENIQNGDMPGRWYVKTSARAIARQLKSMFGRGATACDAERPKRK